jgi:hypothetical protein
MNTQPNVNIKEFNVSGFCYTWESKEHLIENLLKDISNEFITRFIQETEHEDQIIITLQTYETFWDYIKFKFFPSWLKKKYPIQYRTITKSFHYKSQWTYPNSSSIIQSLGGRLQRKVRIAETPKVNILLS